MADRVKPSDPEVNEYAGFIAPERADASTIAGQGYYGSNGEAPGNVVDRNRINKTLDNASSQKTTAKPAGPVTGTGY